MEYKELLNKFKSGEWFITGNSYESDTCDRICGLCDKENLKYLFEIASTETQETIWVGSKCIENADNVIVKTENGKWNSKLAKKSRIKVILHVAEMKKIYDKLGPMRLQFPIINSIFTFIEDTEHCTPKQAATVIPKLLEHGFTKKEIKKIIPRKGLSIKQGNPDWVNKILYTLKN